jgi:segregation and condensation protein B
MTEQEDMTIDSIIKGEQLQQILEAILLAAGQPLSTAKLAALFNDEERPPTGEISRALEQIGNECAKRGVELIKVASGFRFQVKQDFNEWVSRLWKERPPRYSRALLETIALIAYRQPITRGEIESVRGVSVSTSIIRTLQEREWIRVVGHRDVPGKPALFGTTSTFLDSFGLQTLDELPTLAEIRDMENLEPELQLEVPSEAVAPVAMDGDKPVDPDENPAIEEDYDQDEEGESTDAEQDTVQQ